MLKVHDHVKHVTLFLIRQAAESIVAESDFKVADKIGSSETIINQFDGEKYAKAYKKLKVDHMEQEIDNLINSASK